MSKVRRGGTTLKTGKIGRVNCLRQQMMMPGERMNVSMKGKIRLESLRERDAMRINAHLATFMIPLRWLWSQYPDYVKEGPDTAITPPTELATDASSLGVGSFFSPYSEGFYTFFRQAVLRIYNEWYKWPEDADATTWNIDGNKAVPLSKAWSRCRYQALPDAAADYQVASGSVVDVTELAEKQARFRSAMKRDVLSFNRWIELVKDTYKGDGSREVDQVPIMLDQTEVGVSPRDLPATDGASLGQWQSLYDFDVDHQIRGIVAPEHCIITTMLTVRFPAITEGVHPLATDRLTWHELTADPEWFSAAKPVTVSTKDLLATSTDTTLGYLPAGWQWRTDHDVIGQRIYNKNSFPYMNQPTTQAEAKDATRVKDAFRSQTLGDYYCDLYFDEQSTQPIGDSMDSYMSGMVDETKFVTGGNQEFPKGGKQL